MHHLIILQLLFFLVDMEQKNTGPQNMDPKIIGPQQLLDPKIWIQKLLDPQKSILLPALDKHTKGERTYRDFLMPDAVNFGIAATSSFQ